MLIVWGFSSTLRFLGIVTLTCANCHNPAAHRIEEIVRKFTLFWIPLFPVSRRTVITCTFCGMCGTIPKDQVSALLTHAQFPGQQPSGQQYAGQ